MIDSFNLLFLWCLYITKWYGNSIVCNIVIVISSRDNIMANRCFVVASSACIQNASALEGMFSGMFCFGLITVGILLLSLLELTTSERHYDNRVSAI